MTGKRVVLVHGVQLARDVARTLQSVGEIPVWMLHEGQRPRTRTNVSFAFRAHGGAAVLVADANILAAMPGLDLGPVDEVAYVGGFPDPDIPATARARMQLTSPKEDSDDDSN